MGQLWDEEDFWYSNQVQQLFTLFYEAQLDEIAAEAMGLENHPFCCHDCRGVNVPGWYRLPIVKMGVRIQLIKMPGLLQIFATQAASIIENARLYHEVQLRAEQADRLRQIAEMAGSVLSAEQPFKPVLHEIATFHG